MPGIYATDDRRRDQIDIGDSAPSFGIAICGSFKKMQGAATEA